MHPDDTIAALSSPPGSAPRGILRLSGPQTLPIVEKVFTPTDASRFDTAVSKAAPRLHHGSLTVFEKFPLDALLYLWPGTRSYTGESLAEFHLVGSPVILDHVLTQLYQSGARPARQGEFTLRAFLAGKLDLTQAEAVLGVIHARDDDELKTALSQLAGGLSTQLQALRLALLDHLADLEAGLDFVEEDIDFVDRSSLILSLNEVINKTRELRDAASNQFRQDHPFKVVLAGLPNAGKSTLFNALSGQDAAIVSAVRGTTRDYLRHTLIWHNTQIELIDTAGWEQDPFGPMQQAQRLREEIINQADVLIWCTSPDIASDPILGPINSTHADQLRHQHDSVLHALTKSDLLPASPNQHYDITLSVHQKTGLAEIQHLIEQTCHAHQQGEQRLLVGSTAARCRDSLSKALELLESALSLAQSHAGDELIASDLRSGLEHLGEITGAVYTDDLLDRIFSKFCIGK